MSRDISAEVYHADAVGDRPSLSASIIKILCDASPLHAWTAHPRLNPNFEPWFADYADIGTLVHSLVLQGVHKAEVLDFSDWRTKEAKAQRAAVRAADRIPILAHKWETVCAIVLAIERQLKAHADASDAFTGGEPERTIVFEWEGVLFRSRLDYLHADLSYIDDLKTTGISANPETFVRQMDSNGLDIQAALYQKAVELTYGANNKPRFRFVTVETSPPYALSVVEPHEDILRLGLKKIVFAMDIWRECLKSGNWPGYPARTATARLEPWMEAKWIAKEEGAIDASRI